jgi:predicted peroxiredoxin
LKSYLIIQSEDHLTQCSAEKHYALASALAETGNRVWMLLVQQGVGVALKNVENSIFQQLLNSKVKIYADSYALAERGLETTELHDGIHITALDIIVERLLAGDKVIWH